MKEVKELIAQIIQSTLPFSEMPEAILNLHYPCKECGGSGNMRTTSLKQFIPDCPACKGKGHSGKMLAILAENQDEQLDNFLYPKGGNPAEAVLRYLKFQGWKKTKE